MEEVGDQEAQDGVAQELQRLVVARGAGEVLVGVARVGERAVQQREVREVMPEALLEGVEQGLALRSHRSLS